MVKKLLILLSVFCLISVGCWSEETTIFRSFADFEGRKIGTVTGSAYFASVEQVINDPKAYYYDDPSGAILALKKGDIDAYATDTLSVNVLVKEVEGLAAYPEPISGDLFVAYMMRKGDSLVDEINKALAEVKAEGTYEKLYQKWMTGLDGQLIDYSQYNLNDRGNGVLKVVASPMDYPFNFVGGEGAQLQGFEIELLYCIADKLNKGLDITNVDRKSVV